MIIEILTSLAVVVAVSLVLGILLALCMRFFGIEEEEKTKNIRACLPGANCGACGYAGCNDYAEALAKGEAKPNLCIPGGETTAKEIGALLGVEAGETKNMVAFVHCNGTCDAVTQKATYEGIDSCRARSLLYGGPSACRFGCLGCGDCAEVCIANAICIADGIARIDTNRCLGCGLCVKTCPRKIISMVPEETAVAVFCSNQDKGADARKACKNACIGCKKCEKACPNHAITVVNNCAVIDYEKCTGCGLCTEGCPTGCLKKVFLPDIPEAVKII